MGGWRGRAARDGSGGRAAGGGRVRVRGPSRRAAARCSRRGRRLRRGDLARGLLPDRVGAADAHVPRGLGRCVVRPAEAGARLAGAHRPRVARGDRALGAAVRDLGRADRGGSRGATGVGIRGGGPGLRAPAPSRARRRLPRRDLARDLRRLGGRARGQALPGAVRRVRPDQRVPARRARGLLERSGRPLGARRPPCVLLRRESRQRDRSTRCRGLDRATGADALLHVQPRGLGVTRGGSRAGARPRSEEAGARRRSRRRRPLAGARGPARSELGAAHGDRSHPGVGVRSRTRGSGRRHGARSRSCRCGGAHGGARAPCPAIGTRLVGRRTWRSLCAS